MSQKSTNTTNSAGPSTARGSGSTESAFANRLLMNELTAASHKAEAFAALIAGHLLDALEHIDNALTLYELNPSYAKLKSGQFQTLPELLGACVESDEAWGRSAALRALRLFDRMEELGRTGIH